MRLATLFISTIATLFGATVLGASPEWTSLEELEKKLLASNPQIQSLNSKVVAQKSTTLSQYGNFLPRIDLTGGYSENKTLVEPSEGYLGYVSGTWNLFRGGEDSSLKSISEYEFQISQLELELKVRSLTRKLHETYSSLLAKKKRIQLLDENFEILKKQRQMARKKISAGLTSNIDGIEIDLEENSIQGEREAALAEASMLTQELSALLDLDANEIVVSPLEAFPAHQTEVDVPRALTNNPSIQRQNLLEKISHAKLSQQKSEFLPQLDLEGSYGRITPQYADPLRGTESRVALIMSWNLFSGMSSYYKTRAASNETAAQGLEKKTSSLEIRNELENLITARNSLKKIKALQQQRLIFAQKYYEMTLSEYKRGVKNSPDVQTATSSLFESKNKIIEFDRDLSIINAKLNELI